MICDKMPGIADENGFIPPPLPHCHALSCTCPARLSEMFITFKVCDSNVDTTG